MCPLPPTHCFLASVHWVPAMSQARAGEVTLLFQSSQGRQTVADTDCSTRGWPGGAGLAWRVPGRLVAGE